MDAPTPGPWFDWDNGIWLIEPSKLLARSADAVLIATAPEMLAALKVQHEAIDILMAMLIEASRGMEMEPFMPSKSKVWPMFLQGLAAIKKAEGK